MKYLMKLRYVGTDFCGSQIQPNVRTVQGALNVAFEKLFGVTCKVTSCSRTDSGVHACAASLTVELPGGTTPIPPEKLPLAVAPHLPADIAVFDAELRSDDFHVRHDVKEKEYVYIVHNGIVRDPFLYQRAWFYPAPISEEGIARMKAALPYFVGTHDFAAFMAQGSPVATTVRTLTFFDIERDGEQIRFIVRGDGFLYNMVRILVGTLIEIAAGRISPEEISQIIESGERARAGMTAPPEGLYLNAVFYD